MATADVGTLRTRLSWEDDGNSSGMKGFRDDLKGLRSEMNAAKSGGKDYSNSLKGLGQQSDILTRRFKTQKEQVAELKRRYEESRKTKGEDAQTTKDLASQYNNATAQMNRTENQLKTLNEEIRRQQSPWTQLGEKMTEAGDKMQTVGKGMTDFGKSYSMKVTAPIVAGGVAVFKMASDFESAFAGVEKTFPGTVEQLDQLRTGIRDMAKEIPASTTEIASVAEAAGQLGIKAESIEGFTRTMIDMGEATNMTSDQAATSFAQFANVVGMSQGDFDKLGTSVVALGNSMATTEADIVNMAMRLSGTGAQVGLSEAEIMALSAAMASVGIKAEAGGTAMSTVMKKITNAVGEGGKSVEGFAEASGMSSEEFTKAWQDKPIDALDAFIKGLAESGEEGDNLNAILGELGINGINETDTLLRMAGASDLLSTAVNTSTKAWDENSALSEEAATRYATTESQLKILWNRIKDVGITLGEALIPAVMDAIDAAEPLIKKIEEGAEAFSDMDKEQQETILKMIGLVAAIGPAAIALGGLATGIGSVLKIGGGLATALGAAGGKGLIGRIGLMGLGTNPVGLAVLGVSALALGIYAVAKASEESTADVLKSIEAREEEINSVAELIAQFETLQKKNKLSTDEVLRYMDIMDELKHAKSEEAIEALTKEQASLLEKSSLTNEEMLEFLSLNEKVVEKSPETAKAISEQGNAYIEVLDALKEKNAAEREQLTLETYEAIDDALSSQAGNLEKQTGLKSDINELEKEHKTTLESVIKGGERIREIDVEIAGLMKEIDSTTGDQQQKLMDKVTLLEKEKNYAYLQKISDEQELSDLEKKIEKKVTSLGKTEEELKAFNELTDKYGQMILFEQGIVSEKGKAVEKIKEEQKEINKARKELEELNNTGKLVSGEYEVQNKNLNDQQAKIDAAKKKLEDMNEVAGQTVYKDLEINPNPHISTIDRLLSAPVGKIVNITNRGASLNGPTRAAYAAGTEYNAGGMALVGVV